MCFGSLSLFPHCTHSFCLFVFVKLRVDDSVSAAVMNHAKNCCVDVGVAVAAGDPNSDAASCTSSRQADNDDDNDNVEDVGHEDNVADIAECDCNEFVALPVLKSGR